MAPQGHAVPVRFILSGHDTVYGYRMCIWLDRPRIPGVEHSRKDDAMECIGGDPVTWEITVPWVVGQALKYKYFFYHEDDDPKKDFFEDGLDRVLIVKSADAVNVMQHDVWRQQTEHYVDCTITDACGTQLISASHDLGCPLYAHIYLFPHSKLYVEQFGEIPIELHIKREGQNDLCDVWEHFVFRLKRHHGRFELGPIPLYVTHEFMNVGKIKLVEFHAVMHPEDFYGNPNSEVLCGSKWRYQIFNACEGEGWVGRRARPGEADDLWEGRAGFSAGQLYVDPMPIAWCNFTRKDGARDTVLYLIHCAKRSIHASMYNINDPDVTGALIAAHQRGVDVQILTSFKFCQTEWWLNKEFKRLVGEGIKVQIIMYLDTVNPNAMKIMDAQSRPEFLFRERLETFAVGIELGPLVSNHTKFAVFDRAKIVTGSCNWEMRAFDSNSETFTCVEHGQVAEMYECIFESIRGRPPVAFPTNNLDSKVQVYYSRAWGQCILAPLCRAIETANRSILIAVFIIRHLRAFDPSEGREWDLFQSLINAHRRGVDIWILLEANTHDGGKYRNRTIPSDKEHVELISAGIRCLKIRAGHNGDEFAALHHKFMVVDNYTTMTGSFNYWGPSITSDDDILLVKDRGLAIQFRDEMGRLLEWYARHFLDEFRRNTNF